MSAQLKISCSDWDLIMNGHQRDSDATIIVKEEVHPRGQLPRARMVCLDKFLGEGLSDLEIELIDRPQTLGRGRDCSVYLNYKTLSREHARIVPDDGRWLIEDLGSSNGVFVNDQRVTSHALTPGDIVKLASLSFRFVYDPVPQQQTTPVADPPTMATMSGTEKTMYSGHPGVVGSLAKGDQAEDAAFAIPRPEQARKREVHGTPFPDRQGSNSSQATIGQAAPGKAGRKWSVLILSLALIGATAGGTYYYFASSRNQQIQAQAQKLKAEIHKFVENHDSDAAVNSITSPGQIANDVATLKAAGDTAVNRFPDSVELRELAAKIVFLDFQRQLKSLSRSEGTNFEEVAALVRDKSQQIARTLGSDEFSRNRGELRDLMILADAIVRFKAFATRYSTPAADASTKPTDDEIRTMQGVKDTLVKKKRENHLSLSVNYPFFQRLVVETEENDVRLFNRWKDLSHR